MKAENPYRSPTVDDSAEADLFGAQIRVRFGHTLPQLCALCGRPASTRRKVLFRSTFAEFVHIFVNRSPFGESLAASIALPLCSLHRNFRRGWPTSAAVLIVLISATLLVTALSFIRRPSWELLAGALSAAILEAGLLAQLIRRALRLRATKISQIAATLVGIDPNFARACADAYRRDDADVADRIGERF